MLEFRIAREEDVNSVKELYSRSFSDTPEGTDFFFDNIFSPEVCYIAFDGGVLVAMLCLFPASVNGRRAAYLYAAATSEEYRNCGFMRGLVNYAVATCGAELCLTIPAEERLYNFYKKLGFVDLSVKTAELTRAELSAMAKPYELTELVVGGYCGIRNRVLKSNFLFWNNKHIENALDLASLYGGKIVRSNYGYALAYESGAVCEVSELICAPENVGYLITDLLSLSDCEAFRFRLPADSALFKAEPERFGMVRYYTDFKPENVYIGLGME